MLARMGETTQNIMPPATGCGRLGARETFTSIRTIETIPTNDLLPMTAPCWLLHVLMESHEKNLPCSPVIYSLLWVEECLHVKKLLHS